MIFILLAVPVFSETKNQEASVSEKSKSAVLPAGSVGICAVKAKSGGRLFAGETALLTATVFDIKGVPQPNRRIDFSIENAVKENGPKLSKLTGITDKYGNVTVELTAGRDPAELNMVRARAPGVKNPNSNTVLFKIRAWANPLDRLAGNFCLAEDISGLRIDSGTSGGKELPESRSLYLAKKPDMSKMISVSDKSKYSIFKGGIACSVSADGKVKKEDIAGIIGVPFEQVNYIYAPEAFLSAHSVALKRSEKAASSEVYSLEAAPKMENKAYSRLVIYIDYFTGLDVEVEKYGQEKMLVSRTVIKKAAEYDVLQKKWTGGIYEQGKPHEPDPAFLDPSGSGPSAAKCWIPVETETTTYFGHASTVIRTRFEDIKINTGINEAEFTIP